MPKPAKTAMPKTPGYMSLERILDEYGEEGARFAVERARRQSFTFGPRCGEVRFLVKDVEDALIDDVRRRLELPPDEQPGLERTRRDQDILDAVRKALRERGHAG